MKQIPIFFVVLLILMQKQVWLLQDFYTKSNKIRNILELYMKFHRVKVDNKVMTKLLW